MACLVGVHRFGAQLHALDRVGQGDGLPFHARQQFVIAIPAPGDAAVRHAVGVGEFGGQRMADFRLAFKGDTARMVRSRRRGAVIGDILRRLADGGFVVLGVVVVLGLDGDFVSGVFGGEDIALASRACDRIAVAQPLVFDAIARYAVAVCHLCGEGTSHLGIARDGDGALLIDGRRRIISDVFCRLTDGRFVMLGVVVVLGLDGDFVSGIVGGEDIALASRATNRRVIAQPLVFDAIARHTVTVCHLCGERASHLGIARDGDGALLIDGRRRAGRIITCEDFGFLATYMQFTFIERTDFRPILHGQGSKRHFASLRIQGHAIMWFTCSPASVIVTGSDKILCTTICFALVINVQDFCAFLRQDFHTTHFATRF